MVRGRPGPGRVVGPASSTPSAVDAWESRACWPASPATLVSHVSSTRSALAAGAVVFCTCSVPSINACHRRHKRRQRRRHRRNWRSHRSTLPGVCHCRRVRRRRRQARTTLAAHISQPHQGGIGAWSLSSCSSTVWLASTGFTLGLTRPVDQNAEINDNTIRHAISFMAHPRVRLRSADSMPLIISIVQGHYRKTSTSCFPLFLSNGSN